MRLPALLPLLLAIAPAHAGEVRCLTGGDGDRIHLAWKLPEAGAATNASATCATPARPNGCA
jgi:hypothetical protein